MSINRSSLLKSIIFVHYTLIKELNGLLTYNITDDRSYLILYNCLDLKEILTFFDEDDKLSEVSFLIDKGFGESYEAIYETNFLEINTVRKMLDILHDLGNNDIWINSLALKINKSIIIRIEEAEYSLIFLGPAQQTDLRFFANLFEESLNFNKIQISTIINKLLNNLDKLIEIKYTGEVINIYDDLDDYRAKHQ